MKYLLAQINAHINMYEIQGHKSLCSGLKAISLLRALRIGNAHIYDDHIDALTEQIKREPKPFPKINIKNKHENIEDYTVDDIEWEEKYEHHDTIFMKMSA